jgi:hypothetical protein
MQLLVKAAKRTTKLSYANADQPEVLPRDVSKGRRAPPSERAAGY